jgi:hypothetical protein
VIFRCWSSSRLFYAPSLCTWSSLPLYTNDSQKCHLSQDSSLFQIYLSSSYIVSLFECLPAAPVSLSKTTWSSIPNTIQVSSTSTYHISTSNLEVILTPLFPYSHIQVESHSYSKFSSFLFFCGEGSTEFRALHLLGKHSTT